MALHVGQLLLLPLRPHWAVPIKSFRVGLCAHEAMAGVSAWWDGYTTRFKGMWHSCGPGSWSTLFVSTATIQQCQSIVATPVSSRSSAGITAPQLKWAQKVVNASVHPDTNTIIPLPFRMSAHVPCNVVLLFGMLTASSPMAHAVAQTANQVFNVFQFWNNRNASNEVSLGRLTAATTGAVCGAVWAVLAMDRWLLRLQARGARMYKVGRLVLPFVGAACAKPFQLAIMRADEWQRGVELLDAAGTRLTPVPRAPSNLAQQNPEALAPPPDLRSVAAGRRAVGLTIATRILYLVQPMLIPPLIMMWLQRRVWMTGRAAVLTNIALITMSSAVATPACIALFAQRSTIPVHALEPEVIARLPPGIDQVYFNKGI